MTSILRPRIDRQTLSSRGAPDWTLVSMILILELIGLVATYTTTYYDFNADSAMRNQLAATGLGLVIFAAISYLDYGHLRRSRIAIAFAVTVLVLLLLVRFAGTDAHGATRSIRIMGVSLQPSEFSKLAVVIYGATWLASRRNQVSSFWLGLVPYGVITGLMAGLIFIQPDQSTALIVTVAAISMFVYAGANLFQMFALGGVVGGIVYLITLLGPGHSTQRIKDWVNGLRSIHDANPQVRQAWQAFADAGFLGQGPGFGRQKFVPPLATLADTDSVLPVLTEEFGWLGLLLIVTIFVVLVLRCYYIAINSKSHFGAFLVVGIVFWILYQATLNLAGNLSAIPLGGIPVPFISRGGSSTVAVMAAAGILVSVSRGTRVQLALRDPAETVIKREVIRTGASRIFRGRNSRARAASSQRAKPASEAISYNVVGRDVRRSTHGSARFANQQPSDTFVETRDDTDSDD